MTHDTYLLTPQEVVFKFEKRDAGSPYVLWAIIDDGVGWVIEGWDKKPTEKNIEQIKRVFMRSCHVYHKFLKFPPFHMREIK